MYLLNGRSGDERRGLGSENSASFREVVVGEVAVDDESDLHRSYFPFAETLRLFGFGLLPHDYTATKMNKVEEEERERKIQIRWEKEKGKRRNERRGKEGNV